MNRRIPLAAILVLLAAVSLAGCSGSATDSTTEPPATTVTTSAAGNASGGCVACHTDEEALRALAVEPPATEVLSEGEG